MMVRFSCFPSSNAYQRQKKSGHMSTEAVHHNTEDCSQSQSSKNNTHMSRTAPNSSDHVLDHSAIEQDSKSEENDWKSYSESDHGSDRRTAIRKSMSLGTGLDLKGKVSGENESEDEMDQKYSCNGSLSQYEVTVQDGLKDFKIQMDPFQQSLLSDSAQGNSELVNIGSIVSVSDPLSRKEVQEPSDIQLSGAGESDDRTPQSLPMITKSRSMPNMLSPSNNFSIPLHHSRSAEDLNVLDSRRKEMSTHELGKQLIRHGGKDDCVSNNGKSHCEFVADDNYDAYNYVASAKHWIMPVGDEVNENNSSQEKYSHCGPEVAPSEDFKLKRIEEWVMDLRDCNPIEESSEPSADDHEVLRDNSIFELPSENLESQVNPSMEAIKRYVSSLSATSTAAQLVNHGLAVIPFLGAFTSLRALNLSGNLIVTITAGSLPRGLHVLNLSKNKISTVEGLRELTRLRVLDLSYNRILRIGHGLASCSSLKELYLAGNKISEVEGLHRLLKLNVLDLRFNKISTGKCLGQLAANYNSLQAISLEGNPAQKNIGDEQLKKYLHGLLPRLSYYNRQSMKVGTLKDSADRSTRIGISSHQSERSLRAELKTIRRSTLGVTSHRSSSSSVHGRRSHAATSSKTPRNKNGRLPPVGTRIPIDRHHALEFSSKPPGSKSLLSVRRSRSEGNLGAL